MSAPGKTEPTDLVVRARTGDAEAWGDLYREFAPAIFRFCRRAMPTHEDAEDATMEIFMKLRDKLSQFDHTRSFSAWLYKVAANHCWDMLRRRKGRQNKETEDVDDIPLEHPDPNQLERLIEERSNEEVRKALGKTRRARPHGPRHALLLGHVLRRNCRRPGRAAGVCGSSFAARKTRTPAGAG